MQIFRKHLGFWGGRKQRETCSDLDIHQSEKLISMSQSDPLTNPELNQEFFTTLPSEIIIDILSRLPVRTIISCKVVCKSWLSLIETHEFAKSHLSKSVPVLVLSHRESQSHVFEIIDNEDGLHLDLLKLNHNLLSFQKNKNKKINHNLVTKFNLPYHGRILGSVNGLLFLRDHTLKPFGLYICNPITRDYIKLHCPQEFVCTFPQVATYGFGVSKVTGQLKVVRILQTFMEEVEWSVGKCECQVYTLGTRSWKRTAHFAPLRYGPYTCGAFLNGNLHWLAFDLNGSSLISCFDLEKELFSTLSTPFSSGGEPRANAFALRDCLCLFDDTSHDEIVIWLMKEYGVEKSWTKEFVICKTPDFKALVSEFYGRGRERYGIVYTVKVLKNGDILMAWDGALLLYFSKKKKTTQKIDMLEKQTYFDAIFLTPSFLSLEGFLEERM